MLRKGFHPYEYMDDWEKLNETSWWEKEDFCRLLKTEDVTDADYAHEKTVRQGFGIKNSRKYHDLYVQSDTLLLADISENFRNMCINPIQDGFFWGCFLKSVTHILQWWNLAVIPYPKKIQKIC